MSLTNRLRLLGPVQIEQGGVPRPKLGSQKSLLLLAYLVTNPQEQSRARLAALLWPDQPDDKARSNLRWSINNLANLLPNAVAATRHTVQFRPAPTFWVDLLDFTQLLHENQLHTLAAAVELYRGDFLAGITVDDSADLEVWLLQTRESWRQQVITTLERLSKAHVAQQQPTTAQTYLSRLLSLQPWHEDAHRQLMQLLAENGQRSAALAQFELCRKILAEEVAAEPAAETLALYRQIQAGAFDQAAPPPIISAPVRQPLPREQTPFVGRAQQVAQLTELILSQKRSLVSLLGEGGIGKTRLALATARAIQQQLTTAQSPFPDGIWFVALASVEAGGDVESSLVTAIAEAMQVRFSGAQTPKRQFLDLLRGKSLLLILDNFEHLLAGAPLLSQILDEAPQTQFLVTSRSPLALAEEWRFPLLGLALPPERSALPASTAADTDVDTLAQIESIALFVQSARRVAPDFTINADNWPALVAICRYVCGLPLAIELATTWLAHMDCHAIAGEIEQGLTFLTTDLRNVPARHRNMRSVFAYSWQLLSAAEQQTALELAIFRGGCARPAAQAITQRSLGALTALIDKAILQRDEQGRYFLHELLRQFCLEKLAEAVADPHHFQAVQERHSAYYLKQLQSSAGTLKGHDRSPLVEQLRHDLDNIRQAWRWALQQVDWPRIAESLAAFALFYTVTGLLREGSSALQEGATTLHGALSAASPPEMRLCGAHLLVESATLAMQQGNYADTLRDLDAAERCLRELPTTVATQAHPLAIRLLVRRAEVDWYKGEIAAAQQHLQEALLQLDQSAAVQAPVNQESYADILCLRGLIGVRGGNYVHAIDWYDQSHLLSLKLNDAYRTGRALYCLGTAYRNQGQYERARQYLLQGLAIAQQTGDGHSEGRVRNTLGDIELYRGDFLTAQRHYQAVEGFARQIGDRRSESIAHTNLGLVARELGCFAEAEHYFQQSRAHAQAISFQRGEGWNLLCLSLLHQQTENYAQALTHARAATAIFDYLGDRLGHAHSATNRGRALVGLQQLDEALPALERAYQLRQELHQPHLAAEVSAWIAYVAWEQGDVANTLRHLQQVRDFVATTTLDGMEEPIRVCLLCAKVLQGQDERRAAQMVGLGRALLARRAALLPDGPQRLSYLNNILAHVQVQSVNRL